jgi:hypothetical protein
MVRGAVGGFVIRHGECGRKLLAAWLRHIKIGGVDRGMMAS